MTVPAFVQAVGSSALASGGTAVITVSATSTTAGNGVILWAKGSGGYYITGVTDSRGNTWTVNISSSSQTTCSIASCVIAAGKQFVSGDTITVTMSGSQYAQAGCAEFSGLAVSGGSLVPDQTAHVHVSGSPATVATASISTSAGELAVTAGAIGATSGYAITITSSDPDSGGTWTDLGIPSAGTGAVDAACQVASARSEFSATWSWSPVVNGDAVIVTYKGASPAGRKYSTGSAIPAYLATAM